MTINHNNITVTITEAATIKRIIDAIFPTENKGKEYVKKEWGSTSSASAKPLPTTRKKTPSSYKRLTPEDWDVLVTLKNQKVPCKVIAKRLGRTATAIQSAWAKYTAMDKATVPAVSDKLDRLSM